VLQYIEPTSAVCRDFRRTSILTRLDAPARVPRARLRTPYCSDSPHDDRDAMVDDFERNARSTLLASPAELTRSTCFQRRITAPTGDSGSARCVRRARSAHLQIVRDLRGGNLLVEVMFQSGDTASSDLASSASRLRTPITTPVTSRIRESTGRRKWQPSAFRRHPHGLGNRSRTRGPPGGRASISSTTALSTRDPRIPGRRARYVVIRKCEVRVVHSRRSSSSCAAVC